MEAVEVSQYYFFFKLAVETKISKPQDFRTTLKEILACIFLSARPKSLVTLHYEIPCRTGGGGKLVAAALATELEPAAPPVTC